MLGQMALFHLFYFSPGGSVVKTLSTNAGDVSSILGLGRSPGEGNGNPLLFLPGEFHGQRSLMGYSPWRCKESDITEQLNNNNKSFLEFV